MSDRTVPKAPRIKRDCDLADFNPDCISLDLFCMVPGSRFFTIAMFDKLTSESWKLDLITGRFYRPSVVSPEDLR